MTKRGLLSALAVSVAAIVPFQAGAAKPKPAPPPHVAVALGLQGQSPVPAGDSVTLNARVRALPRGYRLLLEEREADDTAWTIFKECATARCSDIWSKGDEIAVAFRARAVHRRSVTKGPITAVAGVSRTVTATWAAAPPPPPPPPPPPKALAGKYCGFNDQGRTVCLDTDGENVTSFSTQSLVTCGDGSQWYWLLTFGGRKVPLTNLSFTFTYNGSLSSSGSTSNIQANYTLSGTFDQAGNASGQIALTSISWDQGGTHYDCASAPYGWHARLGA
jgi:hypothetical protein